MLHSMLSPDLEENNGKNVGESLFVYRTFSMETHCWRVENVLVTPVRAVANDDEAEIERETPSLHQPLFHLTMKQMGQDSFIMARCHSSFPVWHLLSLFVMD